MLLGATAFTGLSITSCVDEPDKYEIAGGTPSIDYVRLCDVTKKDSMLTGAYMGTSICLVGNNLRSITKMLFNDQQAILNTSSYRRRSTHLCSMGLVCPERQVGCFLQQGNR